MKTTVLSVKEDNPDPVAIEQATEVIKDGGVLGIPTDSLYGLGADGTNANAVERVFQIKARPLDKPLLMIVHGRELLSKLGIECSAAAARLMDAFWPGPLSLILPASSRSGLAVDRGNRVGVRIPASRIARHVSRHADRPITAPSANPHGAEPATTAAGVLQYFEGRIDLVLDAGRLTGKPSTIVDMTYEPPLILREGALSRNAIEDALGSEVCCADTER